MSDEEAFTAALKAYHRIADRAISDGQTWEEAMREAIDVYVDAMTDEDPPVAIAPTGASYAAGWRDAMRHVRGGRA